MTRQRHAFVLPFEEYEKSANNFEFGKNVLGLKNSFPRHDRITVPKTAAEADVNLGDLGTFQISWSTDKKYNRNVPFKTVAEYGLHVDMDFEVEEDKMKDVLDRLIGDSHFNESALVETPNWRSFFEPLEEFLITPDSILGKFYSAQELHSAKSVFISYGKLPVTPNPNQLATDLVIEVYWDENKSSSISKFGDKMEVGLFTLDPSYNLPGTEEFGLSGLIRQVGEKKFEKTLFYQNLKHRIGSGEFNASFHTPLGLHPKHVLSFENLQIPDHQSCKLYAKYTIPQSLFLDQYQLADLERSNAATTPTGKLIGVWGETDLEAPVWAVDGWGSESLVQIYDHSKSSFDFELSMHSRYEVPQANATHVYRELPLPIVFWACHDAQNAPSSDIKGINYESVFPEETLFYHISPAQFQLSSSYEIPVAPVPSYSTVHSITLTVILAGVFWILLKCILNVTRRR